MKDENDLQTAISYGNKITSKNTTPESIGAHKSQVAQSISTALSHKVVATNSAIRTVLAVLADDVTKNGTLWSLHAAEYAKQAALVRSAPLSRCSAPRQFLAVITLKSLQQSFQAHKALEVVGWATVHPPRGGSHDEEFVLLVVCLRSRRRKEISQLLIAFKHINMVEASKRSPDLAVSSIRRCWALHDPGFNVAMVIHSASSSDRCAKLTCGWCRSRASRRHSRRTRESWLRGLSNHFGLDAANYFAWVVHYSNCLWFVGAMGIMFTLVRMAISKDQYNKMRPFYCLVVLIWSACVIEQNEDAFEKLHGVEQEEVADHFAWAEEPGSPGMPGNRSRTSTEDTTTSSAWSAGNSRTVDPADHCEMRHSAGNLVGAAMDVAGTAVGQAMNGLAEAGGMAGDALAVAADPHALAGEFYNVADGMFTRAQEVVDIPEEMLDFTCQASVCYLGSFREDEPHWKRWVNTACILPLILMYFLLVGTVFVCLFWFEMWVIFDWGQCARINDENGDENCLSPEQHRGPIIGFLVEICPSVSEGILLELLIGVSKGMSSFVTDRQNWATQSQYDFAFFIQCVVFEMVGKVGFVTVLSLAFVPMWGMTKEEGCEGYPDEVIFGKHALSCIKLEVSYDLRLRLLERSMKGPMLVSMLVAMLVKVILPRLISFMFRGAEYGVGNRRGFESRARRCLLVCGKVCCCCWAGFWRILGLIFLFDCGAVGGPMVLVQPMHPPTEEHRCSTQRRTTPQTPQDGNDLHQPQGGRDEDPVTPLSDVLEDVDAEPTSLGRSVAVLHPWLDAPPLPWREPPVHVIQPEVGSPNTGTPWSDPQLPPWPTGPAFVTDPEASSLQTGMRAWQDPPRAPGIDIQSFHFDYSRSKADSEAGSSKIDHSKSKAYSEADSSKTNWLTLPSVAYASEASSTSNAELQEDLSKSLYDCFGFSVEDAFYQGMRREFNVLDEYLEVLLHFTFFSCFGMVWPLGSLFALMNYLLEFRFDVLKLGYVRRRGLPSRNPSLTRLVHVSTKIVGYVSIVVQVVLMIFPYQQLVVWKPDRFKGLMLADYPGELAAVGLVMVCVLVLFSWLVRTLVARTTRWRRRRNQARVANYTSGHIGSELPAGGHNPETSGTAPRTGLVTFRTSLESQKSTESTIVIQDDGH